MREDNLEKSQAFPFLCERLCYLFVLARIEFPFSCPYLGRYFSSKNYSISVHLCF